MCIVGFKGVPEMHVPGPISFIFMQFFGGVIFQIIAFHVYTPLELISFLGNLGSATGIGLSVIVAIVPCEHAQLRFFPILVLDLARLDELD